MTILLVALSVLAIVGIVLIGAERIWGLLGPADLGDVTFETLQRRTSPNDALACPAGFCPAPSDTEVPVYGTDVQELQAAMSKVIAAQPRVTQVAADPTTRTYRYIQRSAILRFPDTIVVRYIALPDGRSTLAIYSRSQLGYSDMGANKARTQRWLDDLNARLVGSPR